MRTLIEELRRLVEAPESPEMVKVGRVKLTKAQDAAVRAYLLQPRDGSKAEVDAADKLFDLLVRPTDTKSTYDTYMLTVLRNAKKAGYPSKR